ncbi:hypothetical protein FOZ61_004935 [Perkinsus olseni]|uniref:Uncharacterized protein n=1 Tax=Perkinsus olseni TaxID=32597 RepID=A0A7J6MC15_PEROL|nr:hypothetical protein FOZ61_004935 [Perkinsus olseni]
MLAVSLVWVHILTTSVDSIRGSEVSAGRNQGSNPLLPILASVPPNCLPDLERRPEGPPQYCLYIRENKTVQNAGMLLVPNFIDTPDTSSNLVGLSQTPPVSMDLFIISNDSSSPVDMGLRGSGRTNFELSLPRGTKLDVELVIPTFSRIGGDRGRSCLLSLEMPAMFNFTVTVPGVGNVSSSTNFNFSSYVDTKTPSKYILSAPGTSATSDYLSASVSLSVFIGYEVDRRQWSYSIYVDHDVFSFPGGSQSFHYSDVKFLFLEDVPDRAHQ